MLGARWWEDKKVDMILHFNRPLCSASVCVAAAHLKSLKKRPAHFPNIPLDVLQQNGSIILIPSVCFNASWSP